MNHHDREHYDVHEILRDGREVHLRSIRPSDKAGLQDGMSRLSRDAIYTRFHGVKDHLSERELRYFTEIDHDSHVALVGEVEVDGAPLLVAAARFVTVEREPRLVAEVAFAVADDFQGLGIATLMLKHLIAIARDEGIQEFQALVLKFNQPMLDVFARCGLPRKTGRAAAGVLDIHFMLDAEDGQDGNA